MDDSPRGHWPEYLIEAAGLGLFMLAACGVVAALEHPASPLRPWAGSALQRRALTGIAMGLTAVALIYSPWGQRSGAHLNPALTLTFWRLGKIASRDALGYVVAQFAGAVGGVALASALIGAAVLMGIGVYFHVAERHEHEHVHEPLEHSHRHVHDEHHQHEQGPGDPAGEPPSHAHTHATLRHRHPHFPDLHHRHGHRG